MISSLPFFFLRGERGMGFTWFAMKGGCSVVANRVLRGTIEN